MKKYEIIYTKVALKELRELPKEEIKRIDSKVEELETDPRPSGCKKLVGKKDVIWRIRVGDYRILYSIHDTIRIINIRRIGHRGDIYNTFV